MAILTCAIIVFQCVLMVLGTYNECLGIEMVGRLGNLMFQYASLVGICLAHRTNYRNCAHITNAYWDLGELPVKLFMRNFNISETDTRECELKGSKFIESRLDFDPSLMKNRFGTTILQSYLQSWRYFYPHGDKVIRSIYTIPKEIAEKADKFVTNIREQLPSPDYVLVGLHVRLGDKINNPQNKNYYDQWALSNDYYNRAIHLLQQRHQNLAFIVFTGGAVSSAAMESDRQWTATHFGEVSNHTFFDTSNDPYESLHALSACDAIVLGHSSFSWWAAYLSHSREVIAPYHMFTKELEEERHYVAEDYYLPGWSLLAKDKKDDRILQ